MTLDCSYDYQLTYITTHVNRLHKGTNIEKMKLFYLQSDLNIHLLAFVKTNIDMYPCIQLFYLSHT